MSTHRSVSVVLATLSVVLSAAPGVAPGVSVHAQSLHGSKASVALMYTTAHTHDLAFLQTRADVYEAAGSGALVMLSITENLTLDKADYPFVLPNTKRFADSLAAAYHAGCGERLAVTSGVRPIDEQPRNASPESVHPTGMAIDVHKPSGKCLSWLRANLLTLEARHVIEATEERHPPHFHVAVLSQLREPPVKVTASSARVGAATKAVTFAAGVVAPPTATGKLATYRVRAGDNLWTIAERHNMTLSQLQNLNGLHSAFLKVGTQLKLK
jgi:LysM repeat protein